MKYLLKIFFSLFFFLSFLLNKIICNDLKFQYINRLYELEKIEIDIRKEIGFFSSVFITKYKFNKNIKLEENNNSQEGFIFDENLKKIYRKYQENLNNSKELLKVLSFYDKNIIYIKYLLIKNKFKVSLFLGYLFFHYLNKSKLDYIDENLEEENEEEN